jgi:membrane protease YdiL (CAAX protease family)
MSTDAVPAIPDDTYIPPQATLAGTLGVWAAAAIPMGLLAWVVAPAIAHRLHGPEPLARALIACLSVGLIWQFVLVLILVRSEQGSLAWPRMREALWLRAPRNRKTGSRGGRTWLWIVPFALIFTADEVIPMFGVTESHDFGSLLDTTAGKEFFSGNWTWFGLTLVLLVFNTILGEELLFRGWLLPRMNGVFKRWDGLANGVLFAVYHLHQPWSMPGALIDTLALAYPTKWFRSAWMGIVVHSLQSLVITGLLLSLVLR